MNLATCCQKSFIQSYVFHTFLRFGSRGLKTPMGGAQKSLDQLLQPCCRKRLKSIFKSISVKMPKSNRLGKNSISCHLVTWALSRGQIASYL